MSMVQDLANAIARQEGYLIPGTIAQRNNNPGNLRSWGGNATASGYAVFPSPEEGFAALAQQIQLNINRGLTLEEFFAGKPGVYAGYAPSADSNQPYAYAQNVSSWTGIPLGVPLDQYQAQVDGGAEPPATPGGWTDPFGAVSQTWDTLSDNEKLILQGVGAVAVGFLIMRWL